MHTVPFTDVARELAAIGRRFYSHGWVMGTAGNFSSVLSRDPLTLAMTASAVNKGSLTENQILVVDEKGITVAGAAERLAPSAECLLHVEIVRQRGALAGAVLHTHSIWSTILSEHFASRSSGNGAALPDGTAAAAVEIEGYEMLKGLAGVTTHDTRELVPIIDNDQDMQRLSARLKDVLTAHPQAHAVLLRKHGVYTWGASLAEAERHIEILEFLFEAVGRSLTLPQREGEATYGTLENS